MEGSQKSRSETNRRLVIYECQAAARIDEQWLE